MRFKVTRSFFIPAGATKVVPKDDIDAVAYWREYTNKLGQTRWQALGFAGKAQKPSFNYTYLSIKSVEKAIKDFFDSRRATAEYKASRRAERSKPHTLQVGSILSSSWGYDQTNVDFYQVVGLTGKQTVLLRKIAQNATEDSYMSGYTVPSPGQFVGNEVLRKRVSADNAVRITNYSYAYPWRGGPMRWSSYA